jgi:hypothetical protein
MRVSRMLSTSLFGFLISSSVYASPRAHRPDRVYCKAFEISNSTQDRIPVYVTKDIFSSQNPFTPSLPEDVSIDGLQVQLSKFQLFKQETIKSFNMVPQEYDRTTYAVEFTVSANEEIGRKLMGCMMRPVKELQALTFCFEDSELRRTQP